MRLTRKMGSDDSKRPYVVLADDSKPHDEALQEALRKLAVYEDAEEQGRLMIFPEPKGYADNLWTETHT